MIVEGNVMNVNVLDGQKGKPPLRSVSIEGFSVLASDGVQVPGKGQRIQAVVEVHWRKGKRPLHWLRAYDVLIGKG